jgi:hypothetical protein
MYGFEFSWASFQVVEVMSSAAFKEKTIGYLAASMSFKPETDVLMLTTNLIKKVSVAGGEPDYRTLRQQRRQRRVSPWTAWRTLRLLGFQWISSLISCLCSIIPDLMCGRRQCWSCTRYFSSTQMHCAWSSLDCEKNSTMKIFVQLSH